METVKSKRNVNIDLIKIIACFAVIGLHTQKTETGIVNAFIYYLCGFSVPAFFMCTGFFILNKKEITVRYALTKCKSILKIVVLWNVIAICLMMGLDYLTGKPLGKNIVIVFFQEVLGCLFQDGILWHFWYLGALIIIYLLAPLFYKSVKHSYKRMTFIWICLAIICILIQMCSMLMRYSLQQEIVQTLRIWTWLQYLFLGQVMRYILPYINKVQKVLTFLFIIWCLGDVGYQVVVGKRILDIWSTEYFYDSIVTIVWLVLFFTVFYNIKISDKTKNVIEKLSELSMGVYIVHPIVIGILRMMFGFSTSVGQILLFILTICASVSCVWVIKKIKPLKFLVEM